MKSCKAFTLAELMIVLSIIGTIAAFMIPVLHKTRPDDSVLMYRKAFYTIEEAVKHLTNDINLYYDGDLSKGANFCQNMANAVNTIGSINCSSSYTGKTDMVAADVNFTLSNGVDIGGLNQAIVSGEEITICVDINGVNVGLDKGCEAGSIEADNSSDIRQRDQFRLKIKSDGKVSVKYIDTDNYNYGSEYAMLTDPRSFSRITPELFQKNLNKAHCLNAYVNGTINADACTDSKIVNYTPKQTSN